MGRWMINEHVAETGISCSPRACPYPLCHRCIVEENRYLSGKHLCFSGLWPSECEVSDCGVESLRNFEGALTHSPKPLGDISAHEGPCNKNWHFSSQPITGFLFNELTWGLVGKDKTVRYRFGTEGNTS
jgi:hypothetical protein